MCNHTSPTSENNPRGPTNGWLARLLQAAGERLFAGQDQEAAEHGWQITRRQYGLGRSYRDPRFDLERAVTAAKRPNLPVIIWRWRYELALIAALALIGTVFIHALGLALTVIAASAALGALSPPWSRRLTSFAWQLATPHLLRSGLTQARIHNAKGRQPVITRVTRAPFGQRIRLWCPAGTCAEDIIDARATLRAACWAADVRVWRDEQHSQLVTIDIIRRREALETSSDPG